MTDSLEPDAMKVARPVLRGEGSSDVLLPTRRGRAAWAATDSGQRRGSGSGTPTAARRCSGWDCGAMYWRIWRR